MRFMYGRPAGRPHPSPPPCALSTALRSSTAPPSYARSAVALTVIALAALGLTGCDQGTQSASRSTSSASASAPEAPATSAAPLSLPPLPSAAPEPSAPPGDAASLEAACGALTAALPPEAERQGRGAACAKLAVLYSTGEAGEVNHEQAYRLRDHACRLGNSSACVLAGAALASGDGTGKPADQAAAYAIYTKACEAKQAEGCLRVGAAHHRGEGAEKSDAAALSAFLKACELGNAAGCFNAGTLEEAGAGGEAPSGQAPSGDAGAPGEAGAPTSDAARHAKAILHYGMACSGGFPSACYNLALVYDRGVITEERPEWAAELYRRGCDAHHPGACGGLGGLLYTGRGVAQDTARGHEMMQDACAKGSDWGCRLIRKHVGNK